MNYSLIIDNFSNWIAINYTLTLVLFFLFVFFYSFLSLPGLPFFFILMGYLLGIFWSYIIASIAVTVGSFCFFILSKYLFSKFFVKYYEKYSNKVNYFIKDSTFEYLLIFRLIPGTPLIIQNVILSLLNISSYKFLCATILGFTPFILFSILIGNKVNNLLNLERIKAQDVFTWDLMLILIVFITIILIWIRFKKKKLS
tara:strand:+ start:333 stop:929 length:597 start_codon:yes stop_codon:yes gene_type:complete